MSTPALSRLCCLFLTLCLFPLQGISRSCAVTTVNAPPDTIQPYLIVSLCPNETFQNTTWPSDTTIYVFTPGQSGAEDTLTRFRIDVLPAPVFQILGDSTICLGDTTALSTDGFFQSYQWSNGAQTAQISVASAGFYRVTVTDNNDCTTTETVRVSVSDPKVTLQSQYPGCFGSKDGFIRLSGFIGGIAPYQVSVNDAPFSADSLFAGLDGGNYRLVLRDATGCTDTLTESLQEPPLFTVDIGSDRMLFPGETLQLEANANEPVQSYDWMPSGLFDCADCPAPIVAQPTDALVVLEVKNTAGCTARDTLLLQFQDSLFLYVPNAFAPDSGGENAAFSVFPGPGNWQLSSFMLFDRWGGLVYNMQTPVRYPDYLSWDGRVRGKQLAPGVYVWVATLQLTDGSRISRVGDLLVVR